MKVMLDTCVLYPVLLREVLLASAENTLFEPLWSPRILEEWTRRATKDGPLATVQTAGDQAVMKAKFPRALIQHPPELQARLWLPDPDDIHVLAAAIAGHADLILTFNAVDFPRGTLREEGLHRQNPDEFLLDLWRTAPETLTAAVEGFRQNLPDPPPLRALLKRAGLPRLGKAMTT